ncbi:aldehyde dehydrogenase [Xylariaceae sp. FL0255]|nr:aldehyde dehydrogenase [Xylariaceae sp. FL0255]
MAPLTIPFVINGEERVPEQTFEVKAPATGDVLHLCGIATESDATAAVEAAAAAGVAWRETDPGTRRDIFLKASEIMDSRRADLAKYFDDELGIGGGWAEFNINTVMGMFKDVAGRVSSIVGTVPHVADPSTSASKSRPTPDAYPFLSLHPESIGLSRFHHSQRETIRLTHRAAVILREPYGVVLAMAPWNAPLILGTRSVLCPLAAGCTVVLKGSESAPRIMHSIVSILQDAGLPKGALNFITSNPANAAAVTESIISNPHVRKVSFTGSTAIGRIIASMAGKYLKPLVLELGGKAPSIVWKDANLDLAAAQCSLGAFLVSGQVCMSTEKIIVHKAVSEKFIEKLQQTISKMWPDALILINAQPVEKNKKLVADAISKGATVLYGDINAEETAKNLMRPIVVGKVTPEMDIYKQESFGPTVSLIEVDTEAEALRLANDTEYGLSAAVFTEDLRTGLRFAKGIESGAVHINHMTIHDEPALPHGGTKASGYGRFNASHGLDEYLKTKTVTWQN